MPKVEFFKDSLTPNIKRLPGQLMRGVEQVLKYHGAGLSAYAKSNAPWTDRTGNARQGLGTRVGTLAPDVYYLALFHRVPYGIWLEVRWGGEYAIIMPAIYVFGPKVMLSLNKLMARLDIKS